MSIDLLSAWKVLPISTIIICVKRLKNKKQYLVRWKGFTPGDDTWEPEEYLQNAKEKIEEYLSQNLEPIATRRTRRTRN